MARIFELRVIDEIKKRKQWIIKHPNHSYNLHFAMDSSDCSEEEMDILFYTECLKHEKYKHRDKREMAQEITYDLLRGTRKDEEEIRKIAALRKQAEKNLLLMEATLSFHGFEKEKYYQLTYQNDSFQFKLRIIAFESEEQFDVFIHVVEEFCAVKVS